MCSSSLSAFGSLTTAWPRPMMDTGSRDATRYFYDLDRPLFRWPWGVYVRNDVLYFTSLWRKIVLHRIAQGSGCESDPSNYSVMGKALRFSFRRRVCVFLGSPHHRIHITPVPEQ